MGDGKISGSYLHQQQVSIQKMKNRLLIFLSQVLPTRLRKWWTKKSRNSLVSTLSQPPILLGIRDFVPENLPTRRALVTFRPDLWMAAKAQHPYIRLYNNFGFIHSLVQALNEAGFIVDLIDPQSSESLSGPYDLLVAHGGHCQWILEYVGDETPVYQYISGLYWKAFELESSERYQRFFSTRGLATPKGHRRSIREIIDGEEALTARANVLFTIHCPRMIAAYGPYVEKFHFTGLGAYLDDLFTIPPEEKDFDAGRKNFIYVGGTGGNLQKGLDLLIEAFLELPDLHLYIYCKVEEEILQHCHKELSYPNIHYIYHWRYRPFHQRLQRLLRNTNFSVHAPINIGMGTAFMASMGSGLIPVGYVDLADPGECAVLCDSWHVPDLVACIRRAADKPEDWCRQASQLSQANYANSCDPEQVEKNFRVMFDAIAP